MGQSNKLALMITFALLMAAHASSAADNLIPPQFRGAWGYPGVPCKADRSAAALLIDAKTLQFDEYRADVQRVVRVTGRVVRARLAFSGEGHEWSGDAGFALSDSGRELVIRPERDSARYIRCGRH
jgi:hypothetical protein